MIKAVVITALIQAAFIFAYANDKIASAWVTFTPAIFVASGFLYAGVFQLIRVAERKAERTRYVEMKTQQAIRRNRRAL